MNNPSEYIQEVGEIVRALEALGLGPILVGGMALTLMGSQRVTRDFDFVIAKPEERLNDVLDILYGRGFELASQLNESGMITITIDNRNIAAMRLRLDAPNSIFFLNSKIGLRIDLLFDFPIPAAELAKNAKKTKINSQTLTIASHQDLLRLKKMAHSSRKSAGDTQDIAFLKAYQKKPNTD
jgi:hypothetical protein